MGRLTTRAKLTLSAGIALGVGLAVMVPVTVASNPPLAPILIVATLALVVVWTWRGRVGF